MMHTDLIIKHCNKNLLNICLVSTIFDKLIREKKALLIRKKLEKLFIVDITSYLSTITNIENELEINYSILMLREYDSYNVFMDELYVTFRKLYLNSKKLKSPIKNYVRSLKTRFSLSLF